MLSEINEIKTNTKGSHLHVESKKQNSNTENRMVVARGECVGGGWENGWKESIGTNFQL